jgi:hypothetical protein
MAILIDVSRHGGARNNICDVVPLVLVVEVMVGMLVSSD